MGRPRKKDAARELRDLEFEMGEMMEALKRQGLKWQPPGSAGVTDPLDQFGQFKPIRAYGLDQDGYSLEEVDLAPGSMNYMSVTAPTAAAVPPPMMMNVTAAAPQGIPITNSSRMSNTATVTPTANVTQRTGATYTNASSVR